MKVPCSLISITHTLKIHLLSFFLFFQEKFACVFVLKAENNMREELQFPLKRGNGAAAVIIKSVKVFYLFIYYQ